MAASQILVTPYRHEHRDGFKRVVAMVLQEFRFPLDPRLDSDLDDPEGAYLRNGVPYSWQKASVGSLTVAP